MLPQIHECTKFPSDIFLKSGKRDPPHKSGTSSVVKQLSVSLHSIDLKAALKSKNDRNNSFSSFLFSIISHYKYVNVCPTV